MYLLNHELSGNPNSYVYETWLCTAKAAPVELYITYWTNLLFLLVSTHVTWTELTLSGIVYLRLLSIPF